MVERKPHRCVPVTESNSVFTKLPPDIVTRAQKGLFQGSAATEKELAITQVVALDAATGRQKWKFTSPSGAGYSGPVSTDGGLVFGASGEVCFAVDADTGREV